MRSWKRRKRNALTYAGFALVFLTWVFLYRTRLGVHLRAVGENPEAAGSVGINVRRTRYIALMLSGVMAGLGGINMSMGYLSMFQRQMTAGRGYIALAAINLWAWRSRYAITNTLCDNPLKIWTIATGAAYLLSQLIARRVFHHLHFPDEHQLHVPLEEVAESAAHLMLLTTALIALWKTKRYPEK